MSMHDVICFSYVDAIILAGGIVCSWIAIWAWVTRDRE
jgi:hypothetical protein